MLTSFNVLDRFVVDVEFTENPYQFLPTDLFEVGARVNPKRSFLFISKLIGKHLDVHPDIPKATGMLLAHLMIEKSGKRSSLDAESLVRFIKTGIKDEKVSRALHLRHPLPIEDHTLLIGFAETATGLGHAVFSAFDHACFVHTTREDLQLKSVFDFEEEHSHAVDHRCYLGHDDMIKDSKHVVLIDDEMTTGKTSLNLIRSLHHMYPKKQYTILCILDWRNKEQEQAYQELEKELGAKISVVSLTKGTITIQNETFFEPPSEIEKPLQSASYSIINYYFSPKIRVFSNSREEIIQYPLCTGRFGQTSALHEMVEDTAKEIGEHLAKIRSGRKTLVLGMGEFMYIPSRIASYMGEGVTHKSTTRSPIYPSLNEGYPIRSRIQFQDDEGITNYAYNLQDESYDEVIVLSEKELSEPVRRVLSSRFAENGIKEVTFVFI